MVLHGRERNDTESLLMRVEIPGHVDCRFNVTGLTFLRSLMSVDENVKF